MRIHRGLFALLPAVVLGILFVSSFPGSAASSTAFPLRSSPDFRLDIVDAQPASLVMTFQLNSYRFEPVVQDGQHYQRLQIQGMDAAPAPGAALLPSLGVLLGVGSPDGVTLEILDAEYETLAGHRPPPAPPYRPAPLLLDSKSSTLEDGAVQVSQLGDAPSSVDASLTMSQPAALGEAGLLRDQAVVPLRLYPAQYDASRDELRVYKSVRLRVKWQASTTSAAMDSVASPAYEALLREAVANYPLLVRPQAAGARNPATYAAAPAEGLTVSPTLKMYVAGDGIYRLTYTDVVAAGFPVAGVDPRTIHMRSQGVEVPIFIDGEADGSFDLADSLLFYGVSVKESLYTNRNVYWLMADGSPGKRMAFRDGAPGGAPAATVFTNSVHLEEDTVYWGSVPDGAQKDHWFWSGVLRAGDSFSATVQLANLAGAGSSAQVRVQMHGFTDVPGVNPDHHTRLILNGVQISDEKWDGQVVFTQTASADQALLKEGANVLEVQNVGDTGATVDQFLVNWIEVTYRDRYVAEDNRLAFASPDSDPHTFEVSNFDTPDIWTLDVTDPGAPVIITGTVVAPDSGKYLLRFQDAASSAASYFAQTAAQNRTPDAIQLDQPSSWKSPNHQADYIVIAHRAFISDVQPLAAYHEAQGRKTVVVDVEDLYDEFSDGVFGPQAIRDFLAYAYQNWQKPAPTYVLLVGGASIDYKDNLGWSRTNWVPSQVVDTGEFGERVSDNWFVQISGDDLLPDMFIGRLPAQSIPEVQAMVEKVLDYAQDPPDSSWNSKVLLVADDDESTFETISEELANRVPYYFSATKVYVRNYPPGTPTEDIVDAINSGVLMVNYTGHGNLDNWAIWNGGRTFDAAKISTLTNTHKLPVVTVGNCLNGYFVWKMPATAEVFLTTKQKGAVAAWAPSGLDYPTGHKKLLGEFYDAIFQDDLYRLGEATTAAKITTYTANAFWANLVKTYILFGDPATQLGLPLNYPFVKQTVPANGQSETPVDQEIVLQFSKPITVTSVTLEDGQTGPVPLQLKSVDADQTTMTYSPDGLLAHARTYTVTVAGLDRLGNALQDGPVPRQFAFTTTADSIAPTGAIHIPGGGGTKVPVTTTVEVKFSEPVREESFVYTVTPPIFGVIVWDNPGETATFMPVPAFEPGVTYTFQVTGAKDEAGNPLAEPLQLVFTTEDRIYSLYLPFTTKYE